MVNVASLLQITNYVGSLDSSCDLQPIRAKNFVNRFRLILHACVQIFDVMFLSVQILDLNPHDQLRLYFPELEEP